MSFNINGKIEDKVLLQYCPHGINSEQFHPISDSDPALIDFKNKIFGGKKFDFVILYNSRNVHRKRTSNIMLAYRSFCENLTKEQASKCMLILHTEIMQDAGTNLLAIKESFCPDNNVMFSPGKLSPREMCLLYNVADMTVNASSNEGFGLSCAESIICGTPVTVTVTGGLQDQIGQVDDDGNPIQFTENFGSNSNGKYKKHGKWAYPVWPVTRLVQGSIPTPYIFDDLARWEDFAEGFMYWYLLGNSKRVEYGMEGRRWAMNEGGINAKNMSQTFIDGMDFVLKNWVKPKGFGLFSDKDYVGNTMKDGHAGFEYPVIDKDKIKQEIRSQV